MSLKKWGDAKIKKLRCWDVQLIKIASAAFILMIAKLWQPILSLEWHWYLIIFILAAIKPCLKVFSK